MQLCARGARRGRASTRSALGHPRARRPGRGRRAGGGAPPYDATTTPNEMTLTLSRRVAVSTSVLSSTPNMYTATTMSALSIWMNAMLMYM